MEQPNNCYKRTKFIYIEYISLLDSCNEARVWHGLLVIRGIAGRHDIAGIRLLGCLRRLPTINGCNH